MSRLSGLERAYQLADSGLCNGITDIRKRLQAEGYDHNSIVGKGLLDDLGRRCRIALGKSADRLPPPPPQTAEERSERSRKAAASRRANRPSLAELKTRLSQG